ncbi:trypsin-6-like [Cloeon dipterum]|uniref:trypsin-6-like n=1 Tax=Cloeon dipterum TaxID=197152 RepID=UPI00321F988E
MSVQTMCLALIFCATLFLGVIECIVYVKNGREANLGDFPWQVSIRDLSPSVHECGGVIISKSWILTTGSCLKGVVNPLISTGTIDILNPGIVYEVGLIRNHPDYQQYSNSNDIALLKTRFDINFNDFTKSIPLTDDPISAYNKGELAGWGLDHYEAALYSKHLRITEMTVMDSEVCRSLFSQKNVPLGGDQFCAGSAITGACRGDEGGGFVSRKQNSDESLLVGLISDNFCSLNNFPTAFTDVYFHREWIRNITGI